MLFEKLDGGVASDRWLTDENGTNIPDLPEGSPCLDDFDFEAAFEAAVELADAETDALFVTEKEKTKIKRRKNDYKKARRKARIDIARSCDGNPRYDNLHQYSKNKIHCSCRCCRGKDYFGRHITTEQEIRSADEMRDELADLYEEKKGA